MLQRRTTLLLLPLLLLAAGAARGQGAPAPFETLTVSVGQSFNVNRGELFHDFWRFRYGWEGEFSTPFYFGYIELGGVLHRYANTVGTVPDFDALQLYAGWGPMLRLGQVQAQAGFRIGNHYMAFAEPSNTGRRNESELLLGLLARVQVRLVGGLGLHFSGTYTYTFTFEELRLLFATVGLSYELDSPRWLKGFLR